MVRKSFRPLAFRIEDIGVNHVSTAAVLLERRGVTTAAVAHSSIGNQRRYAQQYSARATTANRFSQDECMKVAVESMQDHATAAM